MTAEAMHRLASDPVLPFYPLDIALDVQNKLKGNPVHKRLPSVLSRPLNLSRGLKSTNT